MPPETPSNEELRHEDGVIDQRQQQIDPAGTQRENQSGPGPKRSQKQPGQALDDPQQAPDHAE